MSTTDFTPLVVEKLGNAELKLVGVVFTAIVQYAGADAAATREETIKDLKRYKENFNYNIDRIISGIKGEDNADAKTRN